MIFIQFSFVLSVQTLAPIAGNNDLILATGLSNGGLTFLNAFSSRSLFPFKAIFKFMPRLIRLNNLYDVNSAYYSESF